MKKLLFTLFAIVATLQMRAQTVVDVIVNSPDHNTLETAVIAADLAGTLSGAGPFTVFAPTDAAFSALPDGVLDLLLADPSGQLTQVLLYHVVSGSALSSSLSDGQQITTLFGQNIAVTINGNGVFINNAQVTTADIVASNGVVHVIDAVLVPTVWNVIVNSPVHTTLETAVLAAALEGPLSTSGPFTVFAPTDAAFAALPAGTIQTLLADPTGELTNILLYHVAEGTALSSSLADGQSITMLNESEVTVTVNGNGVFINGVQVILADIPAINGVVHVLDAVLLPAAETTTVFDIISESANHNTLEAAINAAGLAGALQGAGPLTVFAPTDAAFGALPAGTVEALLADIPALTAILTYHVAGVNALSTDLSNGQVVATLNGGSVTVTINANGVFINNAKVTVADIVADNGVVHVIDAVLLPAAEGTTVYGIISASDAHNTLEAAINAAGLNTVLEGEGPFTVFAPTDAAFAALPAGTVEALLADIPTLTAILTYHVAGATAYSTTLVDGQTIETVNGEDVTVTINGNGVFINDAQVTVTDLVAENGIVHVINAVLLPPASQDVALVQIIHNAADAAAAVVDVYAGGELIGDDFAFRTATSFLPIPANTDVEIAVAPSNSTSAADAIFTTTINLPVGNYIAVANGIVSASGYSPAPAFTLHTFAGAKFQADMNGMPEVLVYHGATDAPAVDVLVTAPASLTLVDDIAYGEFDGYNAVALADYTVAIAPAAGTPILASYLAPLQTLNGNQAALTVLASGFLTPANNSNGPAFGLYYTTALGGALAPLPVVTSIAQAEAAVNTSVYPNPANGEAMLEFTLNQPTDVSYRVTDISGKTLIFRELGTLSGIQRETLNLNGLSAGIYLIELNTVNGKTVQRISVK